MNSRDDWQDPDKVIDHLAHELIAGRLGLCLGAGLSSFYGLPNWPKLVERLCTACAETRDVEDDVLQVGALRAKHYANRKDEFLTLVSGQLYESVTLDFNKIQKNDLLSAIGALVMSSKRGSASSVITFNYDDLLEIYLEFHGLVVEPIWRDEHWASNADIRIYHPHGFLPLDPRHGRSDDIVIGTHDYQKIMSPTSLWRALLQTMMRTHTFLYIGLSGRDQNLQTLVGELAKSHVIQHERIRYHGVRFSTSDTDSIAVVSEESKVWTYKLNNFDELPALLFRICQEARDIRTRSA